MRLFCRRIKFSFFISVFFYTVISQQYLYSQETLSAYNTSWTSVLPGTALCEPALTSYGFCISTDARNIMGYSSAGKPLWEKNIGRVRNMSLTTLNGDFILFYDKDKRNLKLFNPSGSEIWSKSIDFKISDNPFAGRDGRFFLYGENKIVCLGINGIERWRLETDFQKALPMQELPDGSVIVFLNDINGKTRGLRVSPFGEELENITFAGSIKNTYTCKDGILITFTDGSSGLFALNNGLAESKWVASVKGADTAFIVSSDHQQYRLLSLTNNDITIYFLDSDKGAVISSKCINDINGKELLVAGFSDAGIYLADNNKAVLYDSEYNEVWSAKLPVTVKNKTVNQITYLQNDFLVLFSKNWSIDAYHTSQTTSNKKNTVLKNIQSDYSYFAPVDLAEINYYTAAGFFSDLKDPATINQLKKGLYGKKEAEWLTQTLSVAKLYFKNATSSDFGIHTEKTVFETDSAGFETILVQLALLCTDQTQAAVASIISESNNKLNCRTLLSNLFGYDPEGKLLDAIERNASRAGNKDSAYLCAICDAVYSICLFMGRPAYNTKGKEILKQFLGNGYSFNTRTYARDTLKKIISLEL